MFIKWHLKNLMKHIIFNIKITTMLSCCVWRFSLRVPICLHVFAGHWCNGLICHFPLLYIIPCFFFRLDDAPHKNTDYNGHMNRVISNRSTMNFIWHRTKDEHNFKKWEVHKMKIGIAISQQLSAGLF